MDGIVHTTKRANVVLKTPLEECADFGCFWDADDDYICEDEERTAFEK